MQAPGDGMLVVRVRERELSLPDGVLVATSRLLDADCSQHRVVEELRRGAVGGADSDVVEHLVEHDADDDRCDAAV